jgi:hypothetical protein
MALNIPTKPQPQTSSMCFPEDLIQNSRSYYTNIMFTDYSPFMQINSAAASSSSGYKLPLPRRINDVNTQMWNEVSANPFAGGTIASLAGAAIGESLNPLMFMTYQRPAYKEHELSWILSASSQKESDTLKSMINDFKKNSYPTKQNANYKYPKICNISFKPNDYLFEFKPCAVIQVLIDHTASGGPSFYKSGAPTVVGLTLRLKEIQLWTQTDMTGAL